MGSRLSASCSGLLLIFFSALYFPPNVSAIGKSSVSGDFLGVVDLSALILFHPLMLSYEPTQRAFQRQLAGGEVEKEVESRKARDNQEKSGQFLQQQRETDQRLATLHKRYEDDQTKVQTAFEEQVSKMPKGKVAVAKAQHEQKMIQREQKYHAEFRALQAQSEQLAEKIIQTQQRGQAQLMHLQRKPTRSSATLLKKFGR
ncbi:MAG: hypothetical protein WA705_13945 [Candidatus Ozemobacteraceae bacterium]